MQMTVRVFSAELDTGGGIAQVELDRDAWEMLNDRCAREDASVKVRMQEVLLEALRVELAREPFTAA